MCTEKTGPWPNNKYQCMDFFKACDRYLSMTGKNDKDIKPKPGIWCIFEIANEFSSYICMM